MGSQKRLVQRVERKLEQTVGDAFARIFGGSIVPQEVEALLRREAADGIQSLQGNRLLAPNEYIITLGVHDFEKLGADPELKSTGFARDLADYIQEQGWQTYGDVVVRFEQSSNLHTGQFRARGTVNPDVETHPPVIDCARPQSNHAFGAEPGVAPMSDNSSYRGGQGQGRPDEYYDDRYARPQEDPRGGPDPQGGSDPRGGYPPETGGYPPQPGYPRPRHPDQGDYPEQIGYPDQGGYPEQRGYPDQRGYQDQGRGYPDQGQGGYPPPYEQRPPVSPGPAAGYGAPGYDQGYRQSGGYGPSPGGGQPGYGGYGEYGRGPARHEEGSYVPSGPPGRPSNDRLTPTKAVTTRATSKAPRHTAGKTMAAALTTPATPNPRGPGIRSSGWRVRRTRRPRLRLRPIRRSGLRSASARWLQRLRAGRLWVRRNVGYAAARRRQRTHLPAPRGLQHHRSRTGRPVPAARHRCVTPSLGDPVGRAGRIARRPELHQRHHC